MKKLFKLLILVFVLNLSLNAIDRPENNIVTSVKASIDKDSNSSENIDMIKIKDELKIADESLHGNIWRNKYNTYLTYRSIEKELTKIKKDEKKYSRWKENKYKELSYQLKNKIKIKNNELSLLIEYKESPIGNSIKPDAIDKKPEVSNPFNIIEAYTYIQNLQKSLLIYENRNSELTTLLGDITTKIRLLKKLTKYDKSSKLEKEIKTLEKELSDFIMVVDIVSTTSEVYEKKIAQVSLEVDSDIYNEITRTIKISTIIFILFILSLGIRMGIKKFIKVDDYHYTANKLISFFVIVIFIFILLFSYIDNASYLVTVLGFASAGIAIALKDWFMSIFGWIAIMTSGAIHVGDRIKVTKDGTQVVGDVLDISLLKISIREDITLTSYMHNRRTGRVFFIPNNYIFTDLIANYTFDGLRTVWDGIDLYITFESNHQKAIELAKAIAQSHAKGYTELTKKRLDKLKTKYILRSSNPEPRVFAFTEPYGIVISTWYYTNSYATLGLRSTINMEILEAFKAADDITIAYPTQTVRVNSQGDMEAKGLLPGNMNENGLFDGQHE